MAVLIAAGTLVTLAADREDVTDAVPGRGLRHAVIDPVQSFLARPSSLLVLAFVALFKLGEAMAGIMTAPFYRHLDFDSGLSPRRGGFRCRAPWLGFTLGGWLVARIGVGRALLWTGWAQTVAMAMYVLLSLTPGQHAVLYATVTAEAFAQGLADAAFLTFLSALCAREFAATQYALLSSVPMLAIHTIGGVSGVMAASLGWTLFYTVCMAGALPGMGVDGVAAAAAGGGGGLRGMSGRTGLNARFFVRACKPRLVPTIGEAVITDQPAPLCRLEGRRRVLQRALVFSKGRWFFAWAAFLHSRRRCQRQTPARGRAADQEQDQRQIGQVEQHAGGERRLVG